jgi:predicted homoserine dehydrogenase-like protein
VELIKKLRQREQKANPIRVGIIGCGQMGSGLAHAIENIPGMTVRAIADIDPNRAINTFLEVKRARSDIIVTENIGQAQDALKSGKAVVSADAGLLTCLEDIDANVEATGIPDIGAQVAWSSIKNKKPIIMLNVETDVTVGVYLNHLARKAGSVYTVASGDEPGVCKMLYEQATLMGFEVVCLGKGKNNPIDFDATPEKYAQEAISRGINPQILTSFVDGTKTMVEMAAVSNATGLLPDVPGMHGPKVDLSELTKTFIPKSDGGILNRRGAVDYSTGAVAPGVFAVVYAADARMRKDMKYMTKAQGPYYLQFRPYHLCDLETPQSVAEAVLLGEVTIASEEMSSEVVAVAKRRIKAGQKLEGIGSADLLGTIYTYKDAKAKKAVPVGIADKGTAIKDIPKGEILTEDNFAPDTTTFIYHLRKQQDLLMDSRGNGI